MRVTNNDGLDFESCTEFAPRSDTDDTLLDLDVDQPLGMKPFNVQDVISMFPFWSLKPREGSYPRFVSNNASKHFDCHLQVIETLIYTLDARFGH